VIIPTRSRAEILAKSLPPLLADPATSELLVIVDGHDAATDTLLSRVARDDQRVRPATTQGRGSGSFAGRQVGAELARSDVLLFLDDDVVAEPGLVTGHARFHTNGDHTLILGYMPVHDVRVQSRDDVPAAIYDEAYESSCKLFEQDPESILFGFWSGNFSIRRDVALRIGLFDPAFSPTYHADRDFGLRCRAAGLQAVFERSLRAQHHYRRNWAQFETDCRRQGVGQILVHSQHEPLLGPLVLDNFLPGGPRLRRMIREACRPRLRPFAYRGLAAAASLACAAGRPDLAVEIGKITRAIGFREGAIAQRRAQKKLQHSPGQAA
jgi:hypothetical protein